MSHQLINNLFSRVLRPGPRLGRRQKELKNKGWGFRPFDFQA